MTVLCVASFFKGNEFIREWSEPGASVALHDDYARRCAASFTAIAPAEERADQHL